MASYRWHIDELKHAGPEHLDPKYVAAYERKAGFDPADDLDLLAKFGLGRDSVLVDLGTGTGRFALAAARRCQQVVAVDPSPAMVGHLTRTVEQLGLTNVEIVMGGFLSYNHRGSPADFVFTRNALHHLPDFWKGLALGRVAAILRPGGVLRLHDIVYSFEPKDADDYLSRWIGSGVEDSRDGWTPQELAHHVRDEYSTFSWLLEPILEHAGFNLESSTYSDSRTYAAYVCRTLST